MFYSIRGKLIHKEVNMAVVECGGIGYKCLSTINSIAKLERMGEVTLYTHLHVREDNIDLFGFCDQTELNCFKLLISVSGVGPSVGLNILSQLSPERFAMMVAASDIKGLTQCKGVGAKLAGRIVLELKDKLQKEGSIPEAAGFAAVSSSSGNAGEAVSALTVLGFSQTEAVAAVSRLPSDMTIESMIKEALKKLTVN